MEPDLLFQQARYKRLEFDALLTKIKQKIKMCLDVLSKTHFCID